MAGSPLKELQARGLIKSITSQEGLATLLGEGPQRIYVGFDPTASSLHVGHLLPALVLAHFQREGHTPIAVVGGATGMIGDPSGRSSERQLLDEATIAQNVAGIGAQLRRIIGQACAEGAGEGTIASGGEEAMPTAEQSDRLALRNNADWISPISFLTWLRDVGKHFSVNYMIAKESVRARLEEREQGISYTEFSYMLLQAYDFLHLYRHEGCRIQGGGNDQWGNITAGIELVRRKEGAECFGLTFPLVTTAGGEKIGKSAGNAVWLDPALTSPYQFYQYWMQIDDRDVGRFLRYFTFLPLDDIAGIEAAHAAAPHRREGQRSLAIEVTRLVHGEAGLASAQRATEVLFGREIEGLTRDELLEIFADVPTVEVGAEALDGTQGLVELLGDTGILKSRGEARRRLEQGGVYVNNRRWEDATQPLQASHLACPGLLVIRIGKKSYHLVRVAEGGARRD